MISWRKLFGVSDGNGGIDWVSLAIALFTLTAVSVSIWAILSPSRQRLPVTSMRFEARNVTANLCPGSPLEYDSRIEILADTVITDLIFVVVDAQAQRTVHEIPLDLRSVRLAGEAQDWTRLSWPLPELPPGRYSARLAALIDGRQPAIRVTDFEVLACN